MRIIDVCNGWKRVKPRHWYKFVLNPVVIAHHEDVSIVWVYGFAFLYQTKRHLTYLERKMTEDAQNLQYLERAVDEARRAD